MKEDNTQEIYRNLLTIGDIIINNVENEFKVVQIDNGIVTIKRIGIYMIPLKYIQFDVSNNKYFCNSGRCEYTSLDF